MLHIQTFSDALEYSMIDQEAYFGKLLSEVMVLMNFA